MADALGYASCRYCGAEYRLFTIFNRDMQALCNGWKHRHERSCKYRTPAQRRKWAKPYIGKDRTDSSIVVYMDHPGFQDAPDEAGLDFDTWFSCLADIVLDKTGIQFQDQDSVREDFDTGKSFTTVAYSIVEEYSRC